MNDSQNIIVHNIQRLNMRRFDIALENGTQVRTVTPTCVKQYRKKQIPMW